MAFRLSAACTLLMAICLSGVSSCTKQSDASAVGGWARIRTDGGYEPPQDTSGSQEVIPDPIPEPPVIDTRKTVDTTRWFLMRGIQPSWEDVNTPDILDYIDICKKTGINTISVWADKNTKEGKEFLERCKEEGIDVECEGHMMSTLLPRRLFSSMPDAFRMDENGNRTADANACASNAEGLEIIYRNAVTAAYRQNPTNHRYYCWFDDVNEFCHCPECSQLSASEQALIIENVVIKAIRSVDPEAMLAHLSYGITYSAPVKVKPEEGIFLEFAPIDRNRYHPLKDTWVSAGRLENNAKLLRTLKDNLDVFPVETAMVLEYWMDESLFCGWDPGHLVKLPWDNDLFLSDLKTYASFGIRNIQCYCYYVGSDYVSQFGYPSFLEEYGNGLYEFVK